VETTGEVLKHLETCEACSHELESRMRVRDALRKAIARQSLPEGFEQAVYQRLRRAQPRFVWESSPTTWAVALATLALVVFAGAVGQQWLKVRRGRQMVANILELGASDHLHCAIKAHNYPEVANPPDQLRKKLGPEYAGLLPVVQERLPAFQVLEAHICSVNGSPRKYIHFIARGQGTILSVILTKREGESLRAGRSLVAGASGGVDLYKAQLGGFSVAGFESNEYFGFVVSDLGQNEILGMATGLAPPLRSALDGGLGTAKSEATSDNLHSYRV
jgi:hypothetical protein